MFYDTHKISIENFIEKLEKSEDPQSLIDKLFDDESHGTGRRGVKNVKQSFDLVKMKMRKKERFRAFARKFTDETLTNQEIKSTGFGRSDMLY